MATPSRVADFQCLAGFDNAAGGSFGGRPLRRSGVCGGLPRGRGLFLDRPDASARFALLAGVAQLVEHQLPKLRVAGSNPVSRF